MNPAVGKKLRQARQNRDISIDDVEKSIHIRAYYLSAMEAGNFDVFPSQAQAHGFLRAYADFLDLDGDLLLEALEKDTLMTLMSAKDEGAESESAEQEESAEDAPTQPEPTFKSIGEALKSQRDILGLSLEDVERHTHLKTHYLEALESGDFDSLPSMTQGSGMLKNYAQFLSLDPEPLLLQFAERLQAQWQARQEAQPAEPEEKKRKKPKIVTPTRRFFSRELLIGGSLVVFLILFALWAGLRISSVRSQQEPDPTVPSIADVLLPSPTESLAPTPTETIFAPLEEAGPGQDEGAAEAAPAQEEVVPLGEAAGAVRVQVDVSQRAYMRVVVDEEIAFDGRVAPGDAYTFGGEESIEILSGNGEALYVTYNDVELGKLGLFGEVVNVIITANGLLTPTPTITPTPTRTPRTTPTFTPTPSN